MDPPASTSATTATFAVVGITVAGAGTGERRRCTVDAAGASVLRQRVAAVAPDLGCVLLATCHRLQLVLSGRRLDGPRARAVWDAVWADPFGPHGGGRAPVPQLALARAAVTEVFRIACGLESPMLGDTEVLGQLRDAWQAAAADGHTTRELDELLRSAIQVGRRARSETGIAAGGAGVAGAVLTTVRRSGRSGPVLVLGAGGAGRAIARRLAKHRVGPIVVANRSAAPARELADGIGASAVTLGEVQPDLTAFAFVVNAVPRPVPGFTAALAAAARTGRPPLVIDVASPAVVTPVAGVEIVHLDELVRLDAVTSARAAARPEVERLIGDQLARWHGRHRVDRGPLVSTPSAAPAPRAATRTSTGWELTCAS